MNSEKIIAACGNDCTHKEYAMMLRASFEKKKNLDEINEFKDINPEVKFYEN